MNRSVRRANPARANRSAASRRAQQNAASRQGRRANARTNAVRHALNSRAVAGQLRNGRALRDPRNRARIASAAATAGWQHHRGGDHRRHGWWRHRHGGYGWVGPLFWPFAYYDVYDYTLWGGGYDDPFWDYGYNDIYAGVFAPYGYDALSGYLPAGGGTTSTMASASGSVKSASAPSKSGTPAAGSDQLARMCGDEISRDIAGLPIDQIQKAIQPNEEQRAALDDLANASVKAAQDIRASCPTTIALTAPARLAAMQTRIEAMIGAVANVQPPLDKFYGLLSDEQKARLNALGADQREAAARTAKKTTKGENAGAQSCEEAGSGALEWPTDKIRAALHPTAEQEASLSALQDASVKAADMLKASCAPNTALTPPARLEAVGKRLDTMLQAVQTVRAALDDLYGKLTDEQKAQFEAIGPQRQASLSDTPQADDPVTAGKPAQTARHRSHVRYYGSDVPRVVRQFIRMMP